MNPNRVVTRFEPSPTGQFHVGGIRSALYNYLYARQHQGTFILRCADTDPARSKKEYEDYFLEVFEWLGLTYDAYYRQSERTAIYRTYIEKLIAQDKAYISKETPTEPGQRAEVIRLRNEGGTVSFHDEVLGDVTFNTAELGDFVIARDIESPLYHLTVVIDDFEMGVTHIIRGQEHVSNTPRQILIQEAIGAPRPVYAHGSIILNEERAKLSKRDPLVRPTLEYREEGFLPEAMLNFMALLGWNPGTEQEIFTLPELIKTFTLERMQKQGAIFNPEKLLWVNKEHIARLSPDEFISTSTAYARGKGIELDVSLLKQVMPLLQGRVATLTEALDLYREYEGITKEVSYSPELLLSGAKTDASSVKKHLDALVNILSGLGGTFTADAVKEAVYPYATEAGRASVLWPMRVALSGQEKSPDPFTLAGILGKEKCLERIVKAAQLL